MKDLKVVFMGTPEFACPVLETLIKNTNVVLVVTQPDAYIGRKKILTPSPIKSLALENNIEVFTPHNIKEDYENIINSKPDIIITCAYGQIIPKILLDLPKYKCVNVHASLLPKYRGANPIQRAIINGDKETGICTMITELGLDCGDICMKYPIEITPNMNCVELFELCAANSPELLEKTLIGIKEGTLKPVPQCEDGVCFADKLQKEECKIDWTKSAQEIHNLVRGVYKCPGAFFDYNGKIIKVLETEPLKEDVSGKIGSFVRFSKLGIDVKTGNGLLRLIKVKPEGKGEMLARDWANGIKH